MVDLGLIVIISAFILYYITIMYFERRIISEPKDIIDKFLSFILLYAGISLIYFAITGKPFLSDSTVSYSVYIFIIGFIAMLWTIPHLLEEFTFFKKFFKMMDKNNKKKKKKKESRIFAFF